MTTYKQDRDFAEAVLKQDDLLEKTLEWIKENLSPEDVFDEGALAEWAEKNSYVLS